MARLLKDGFLRVQAMLAMATDLALFDANRSGTSTSIVVHDMERRKIWVAHVGDTSLCVARNDFGAGRAHPLTQAHTPESKEELVRVRKAGADVWCDGVSLRIQATG